MACISCPQGDPAADHGLLVSLQPGVVMDTAFLQLPDAGAGSHKGDGPVGQAAYGYLVKMIQMVMGEQDIVHIQFFRLNRDRHHPFHSFYLLNRVGQIGINAHSAAPKIQDISGLPQPGDLKFHFFASLSYQLWTAPSLSLRVGRNLGL